MKFPLLVIVFISIACSKTTAPAKSFDPAGHRFEKNGYTLQWQSNDNSFDPKLKQQMVETFFAVYPALAKEFNPSVAKTVNFKIDTAYKGVAATSGASVVYNPSWFKKNPSDIDVVTHEVMHIVQSYPACDPWWMVEGIADYVRYKYGLANAACGWSLPPVNASQNYDNGYRITARFLAWCEKKTPGCVKTFDSALRANSYAPTLWNTLFSTPVEALWKEYTGSPDL